VRSSALLPQKVPAATVSTQPSPKTPERFLHFRLPTPLALPLDRLPGGPDAAPWQARRMPILRRPDLMPPPGRPGLRPAAHAASGPGRGLGTEQAAWLSPGSGRSLTGRRPGAPAIGRPCRSTSLPAARAKAPRHAAHPRVRAERPVEDHKRAAPATQSLRVPTLCASNVPTSNASDQKRFLTGR
jgi:hypothetical protein